MQLQYLHTNLTALCGVGSAIDPTRPLFRILTHLELWGKCDDGLHIANLPALTHLCLMAPGVPSVLLSILCNCDGLQVLINRFWSHNSREIGVKALQTIDDPRLVLLDLEAYLDD